MRIKSLLYAENIARQCHENILTKYSTGCENYNFRTQTFRHDLGFDWHIHISLGKL